MLFAFAQLSRSFQKGICLYSKSYDDCFNRGFGMSQLYKTLINPLTTAITFDKDYTAFDIADIPITCVELHNYQHVSFTVSAAHSLNLKLDLSQIKKITAVTPIKLQTSAIISSSLKIDTSKFVNVELSAIEFHYTGALTSDLDISDPQITSWSSSSIWYLAIPSARSVKLYNSKNQIDIDSYTIKCSKNCVLKLSVDSKAFALDSEADMSEKCSTAPEFIFRYIGTVAISTTDNIRSITNNIITLTPRNSSTRLVCATIFADEPVFSSDSVVEYPPLMLCVFKEKKDECPSDQMFADSVQIDGLNEFLSEKQRPFGPLYLTDDFSITEWDGLSVLKSWSILNKKLTIMVDKKDYKLSFLNTSDPNVELVFQTGNYKYLYMDDLYIHPSKQFVGNEQYFCANYHYDWNDITDTLDLTLPACVNAMQGYNLIVFHNMKGNLHFVSTTELKCDGKTIKIPADAGISYYYVDDVEPDTWIRISCTENIAGRSANRIYANENYKIIIGDDFKPAREDYISALGPKYYYYPDAASKKYVDVVTVYGFITSRLCLYSTSDAGCPENSEKLSIEDATYETIIKDNRVKYLPESITIPLSKLVGTTTQLRICAWGDELNRTFEFAPDVTMTITDLSISKFHVFDIIAGNEKIIFDIPDTEYTIKCSFSMSVPISFVMNNPDLKFEFPVFTSNMYLYNTLNLFVPMDVPEIEVDLFKNFEVLTMVSCELVIHRLNDVDTMTYLDYRGFDSVTIDKKLTIKLPKTDVTAQHFFYVNPVYWRSEKPLSLTVSQSGCALANAHLKIVFSGSKLVFDDTFNSKKLQPFVNLDVASYSWPEIETKNGAVSFLDADDMDSIIGGGGMIIEDGGGDDEGDGGGGSGIGTGAIVGIVIAAIIVTIGCIFAALFFTGKLSICRKDSAQSVANDKLDA